MHFWKLLSAFLISGLTIGLAAQGALIVEYHLAGATTTPPADWPATTVAPGISAADNLFRGPGIEPAGLTNGFSANNWTLNSSSETARANGDYFGWGFTVTPGYKVSLSTLDLNMRRSAVNAPDHFELYASLDGFATSMLVASWTYFGRNSGTAGTPEPYAWMTTDTPGQGAGNPILTQNLADDPLLQNIPGGTTVSFRLYGWGNNSGAADSNTIALGRTTATTPNSSGGPSIGGTIELIPEPASLLTLAGLTGIGLVRRRFCR
jgi:hypothetical protein